jgi:hypothetical protein
LGRAQEFAAAVTAAPARMDVIGAVTASTRRVVRVFTVAVEIAVGLDIEAAFAIVPALRHGFSPWRF